MSKEEKRTYLAVLRRLYAVMATKRARERVLDQYCEVTGGTRMHAINSHAARLFQRNPMSKYDSMPATPCPRLLASRSGISDPNAPLRQSRCLRGLVREFVSASFQKG